MVRLVLLPMLLMMRCVMIVVVSAETTLTVMGFVLRLGTMETIVKVIAVPMPVMYFRGL